MNSTLDDLSSKVEFILKDITADEFFTQDSKLHSPSKDGDLVGIFFADKHLEDTGKLRLDDCKPWKAVTEENLDLSVLHSQKDAILIKSEERESSASELVLFHKLEVVEEVESIDGAVQNWVSRNNHVSTSYFFDIKHYLIVCFDDEFFLMELVYGMKISVF